METHTRRAQELAVQNAERKNLIKPLLKVYILIHFSFSCLGEPFAIRFLSFLGLRFCLSKRFRAEHISCNEVIGGLQTKALLNRIDGPQNFMREVFRISLPHIFSFLLGHFLHSSLVRRRITHRCALCSRKKSKNQITNLHLIAWVFRTISLLCSTEANSIRNVFVLSSRSFFGFFLPIFFAGHFFHLICLFSSCSLNIIFFLTYDIM